MTIEERKSGAAGSAQQPPHQESPDRDADDKTKDESGLSEEEKVKREQATNPALMPIGDPAGAA